MHPKDIRYWRRVVESSFDAEAEQLDEIAPILAAGARVAATAAGRAVGTAAGKALGDKMFGEVDEAIPDQEEELPTGEYEVCPECHGEGCINCEAGLLDITGQFEKPDFSAHKFDLGIEENAAEDAPYYDKTHTDGPDQFDAVLHLNRDDYPKLSHLKNVLRQIGMPTASIVPSRFRDHVAVRIPRELLDQAKEKLWPFREESIYEYEMAEGNPLEETYSSPPPFADMIAAGFPDVAPGDRIRTRKGNYVGVVTTLRVHPKKGTEEVFFTDDTGKKFKTSLGNVLKISGMQEGRYDGEFEEDEPMFKDGDKVRLKPEYADSPGEVFWVSQCDPERGRCWIGDAQGRGWYARFGQLEPAKKKKRVMDEVNPNSEQDDAVASAYGIDKRYGDQVHGRDYNWDPVARAEAMRNMTKNHPNAKKAKRIGPPDLGTYKPAYKGPPPRRGTASESLDEGRYERQSYKGFEYDYEYEEEEDNRKIWHTIATPGGKTVYLDHSPYEHINEETFARYVEFYIKNGRFPTRTDINSRGPLHAKDLVALTGNE